MFVWLQIPQIEPLGPAVGRAARETLSIPLVGYLRFARAPNISFASGRRCPDQTLSRIAAAARRRACRPTGCFYEVKGVSTSRLKRLRDRCRLSARIASRLVLPSLMRRSR